MKKFVSKIGQNPFLQSFFKFYQASEIDLTSIAVAYYLLISIFPLLLIVVNILPYFQIPIAEFLEAMEDVLPESLYEVVAKVTRNLLTQPSSGLLSFSILSALWAFSQSMSFLTQRRITFEYILIDSVNASMEEAHALGQICNDFPNCHVNLIPVNGNEHIELYKPSITNMNTFKDIVASYGVSVTVRKEMGDAIQAACGQLKAAHGRKKENHE